MLAQTYFEKIGVIWRQYFQGKLTLSQRDQLLEEYRKKLRDGDVVVLNDPLSNSK